MINPLAPLAIIRQLLTPKRTNEAKLLNPFELMGVTLDSTEADVKKKYYELACLAHPDKGGTHEQMVELTKAYVYVLDQVRNVSKKKVEEYEAEYKAFCEQFKSDHKETYQRFVDIESEAFDRKKFNEVFDENYGKIEGTCFEGGYGSPTQIQEELPDEAFDYDPSTIITVEPFEAQVVEYKEPRGTVLTDARIIGSEGMDDYTCELGSDFKLCFTQPEKMPEFDDSTSTEERFAEIMYNRDNGCTFAKP